MRKARGVSIREGLANVVVLSEHGKTRLLLFKVNHWNNPIPGIVEQRIGFLGDLQLA